METIKKLGIMLDCSRDAVYTIDALKRYVDYMSQMGYTTLQLYTEDTYTIDDPYFGYLRGRYTHDELRELDTYAQSKGVELVPCIQTLAHLSGYLRWNGQVCDCNDILLVDDPATYQLIEKMFDSCAKSFSSRRINIGMDEAHMVGLGKYLDKHGYQNRFEILSRHLAKVVEIATRYGFTPMMWSDMFFRLANNGEYETTSGSVIPQEVIDLVPQNLQLVYWDYYSTDKTHYDNMIQSHKQFSNDVIFGGGAWSWSGFVPHNLFSIEANKVAIQSCLDNGVEEIFLTNWKDDGAECSLFGTLPAMYVASQMAKGQFDMSLIKQGFENLFDVDYDTFVLLDHADNIDGCDHITNPCKYMLYSDPFLGVFDYSVDDAKAGRFAQLLQKLNNADGKQFGYVFDTIKALVDVMSHKYDLGTRLRASYQKGDKTGLKALANECKEVADKVLVLLEKFRAQWLAECKTFGFEKHVLRLGGLNARLLECARRLDEYVAGKVDIIDELEQEILPYYQGLKRGQALCCNIYIGCATIKPFM